MIVGDMIARWTNGCWVALAQPVANPPLDAGLGAESLSIGIDHQTNNDARIAGLPGCLSSKGREIYPAVEQVSIYSASSARRCSEMHITGKQT